MVFCCICISLHSTTTYRLFVLFFSDHHSNILRIQTHTQIQRNRSSKNETEENNTKKKKREKRKKKKQPQRNIIIIKF